MAVAALRAGDSCCPRCSRLADLLRDYANRLSLRDWETQVDHGEPRREGALAEVELAAYRRVARFRVSGTWETLDPDEQRHALAHELLHCHARDLVQAALEGARPELGETAFRVYAAVIEREHERMVDALAIAVSPVLPLP